MKKVFFILFAAIFFLSFSRCEHSVDYARGEFAIYLLADSTLTAVEAAHEPLDALMLSQSPIISIDDIANYEWSDHVFSLKSGHELKGLDKRRLSVHGIPFVVVANNERIYLGAFWTSFSSYAPDFPHINLGFAVFFAPISGELRIEKGWVASEPDLRNDPRIYRALQSAGILIE
jgi:hypothetical protein